MCIFLVIHVLQSVDKLNVTSEHVLMSGIPSTIENGSFSLSNSVHIVLFSLKVVIGGIAQWKDCRPLC